MQSTATITLVDQLEELARNAFSVSERLSQAADELRVAKSVHAPGVAAQLEETRRSLLDLAEKLRGLEKSLSPASPAGETDSVPTDGSSLSRELGEVVSLRPARPDEPLPASSEVALGKKWEEAEARLTGLSQLIQKALQAESASDAAINLGNLALEYHQQGKLEEAEPLYRHALAFREKFFGADHSLVATTLNNLGILCRDQGKRAEAASLFLRSLEISERAHGPEHPKVLRRVTNLANLYLTQEKYAEAKPLFERILAAGEKQQRSAPPEAMASLKKYAEFLRKSNRGEEAAQVDARAHWIREQRREESGIHSPFDAKAS